MGVAVRRIEINAPSDFDSVKAAIVREQPDALILLPVALTFRLRKEFAEFALARRLPSSTSADYGRPFAEIFQAAGYDFYQIDPMLFAPAEVWVSHLDSGRTFHAGATDLGLLLRHWQEEA